jgi:hypothetical protein
MAPGGDDAGPRGAGGPDGRRASDDAESSARPRHRGLRVFVPLVLLLIVAGAVVLGIAQGLPGQSAYNGPPVSGFPAGTLFVNFGLDRSSLTRSVVVSSGSGLSPAPSVLVARVTNDLIQDSGAKQFPADQITLTATPVGSQSIEVVATLSPMNPEKVGDGLFKGQIDVYTGSETFHIPLYVYLTPKSGFRATAAFLLLLLGAALGLSVKWITETLSDLSAAHRRYMRLRGGLGDLKSLPDDAAAMLDEIGDRIKSQDTGQLDDLFKPLEKDRRSLRAFGAAIGEVNVNIQEQEDGAAQEQGNGNNPVLSLVMIIADRERMEVRKLQTTKWPWPEVTEGETVLEKASGLSRQSLIASAALSAPGQFEDVLYKFQRGEFGEAEMEYLRQNRPEANAESSAMPLAASPETADKTRKTQALRGRILLRPQPPEPPREDKSLTEWITKRPRAMAGAASVIVVAIVGLQVQYMNSTSFTGSLSDWLNLLLWAAVIELTGVSLLDVVGRLGGVKPAPAT